MSVQYLRKCPWLPDERRIIYTVFLKLGELSCNSKKYLYYHYSNDLQLNTMMWTLFSILI
uniref:Uncharacterized protein n=1 Tax=Anguilla anguilla TaxID=7936 RepID=A0A0E9X3J3_ANGAN